MANRITTEEQLIREGVDELEPLRFQWLVLTLSFWLIVIVSVVVIFAIYNANKTNPDGKVVLIISAAVSLVILIVIGVISSKKGKRLTLQFDKWRDRVINHLDRTAQFQPNSYIHQSHFDSSGLNSRNYNTYSGGNFLSVENLQMSYLSVQHRYKETYYTTETDQYGQAKQVRKEREVVVPIFNGTLLVLPAPLPHSGFLLLKPKRNGISKGIDKITVASPELSKNYVIGVSDKFIGHRILTPTLMVNLWDYTTQFKYLSEFSYNNNLLYIMLTDVSIGCGKCPTKWTAVTISKLEKVIKDGRSSIDFLKATAKKLKPT